MGLGKPPSPPPAPDANQIIQQQQASNVQTAASQAALNNVNQQGPLGSLTYNQTGTGPNGVPTYTATTNSAFQPGINANAAAFNAQNPSTLSSGLTAATNAAQQYMQPFFNTETSNLQSQLQNQGIDPNSAAGQLAMRNLQNQQTSWVGGNVAQLAPIEQQMYMAPLQAATAAAGGTTGSFINTPQTGVSPTNVDAAYNTQSQAQQYDYGQQMQNYSSMMGGLFGIPSAVLGGWAKGGFGMPSFGGG